MSNFLSKALVVMTLTFTSAMQASFAANVGERFGDWVYGCKATGSSQTVCVISQTLLSKKGSRQVLQGMLSKNTKNGEYTFGVITPLNISIQQGVSAITNTNNKLKLELKSCGRKGCLASKTLTSGELSSLKLGDKLKIGFILNRKKISISLSLKGINAGLKEL